jgi:Ca2+-dependent lipid-binding protein
MFEDAVSAELAQVPPSIASVRLKRFDLGSNAPLVRGIRVVSVSDAKCVADALAYRRSVHATESKNDQYAAGSAGLSGEDLLDTLHKLVTDASHQLRPRSLHSDRARGGGTNRFLSACGEVVLEMDFVFASRDMLVELSLRSADSQSVLPDLASATLSELLLAGQLRLAIQLTEDYPFLGNATVSLFV